MAITAKPTPCSPAQRDYCFALLNNTVFSLEKKVLYRHWIKNMKHAGTAEKMINHLMENKRPSIEDDFTLNLDKDAYYDRSKQKNYA